MKDIKQKGIEGEERIVKLLNKKGLYVVARNYHSRFGEIDIIAVDAVKEKFLFIEVKNVVTQIDEYFPIKHNQIRKIITTSKFWISQNCQYVNFLYEFWGVIILPNKQIQWFELLGF